MTESHTEDKVLYKGHTLQCKVWPLHCGIHISDMFRNFEYAIKLGIINHLS